MSRGGLSEGRVVFIGGGFRVFLDAGPELSVNVKHPEVVEQWIPIVSPRQVNLARITNHNAPILSLQPVFFLLKPLHHPRVGI